MIILVKDIKADNANFAQSFLAQGMVSPTGVCGYARALCLTAERIAREKGLSVGDDPLRETGSGCIVHVAARDAGHQKYVKCNSVMGKSLGNQVAASSMDVKTGFLDVSVVIEVDGMVDERDDCETVLAMAAARLGFCGGKVAMAPEVACFDTMDDMFDESGLRRGRVLVDDVSAVKAAMADGRPVTAVMADLLSRPRRDEDRREEEVDRAAVGVGFRLLEEPEVKAGSRNGYPHAMAEPVIGLVALVGTMSFRCRRLGGKDFPWLWRFERSGDMVVCVGKTENEE